MPWARLDDTFHSHTKVQDALDTPDGLDEMGGPAAVGLWVLALSRSYLATVNRPLVLRREAHRLLPMLDRETVDRLAAILVDAGLWDAHPDGYLIHDWQHYRPPFDSPEAKSLGGKVRAAKAPRQGGKFAPGTVDNPVDNDQQEPAAPAPAGSAGENATSSPGTSTAGPAETSSTRSTRPVPSRSRIGSNPKVPRGVKGGDGQVAAPYLTSPAWEPFLTAWYARFRLPPTEAQAEALWEAVDAYPAASASFVLDCPQGTKAADVIASVLERFHAVRGDALADAARAEVEWDAVKRSTAVPRKATTGPVPLAAVLDDLPM